MNYRYLGRSGLQVSELSLGSWVTFSTQLDVDVAMESAGYQKIGDGAYFNSPKFILVFDLYPKNAVILNGFIHPIDPVIMRATPEFVSELKVLYY